MSSEKLNAIALPTAIVNIGNALVRSVDTQEFRDAPFEIFFVDRAPFFGAFVRRLVRSCRRRAAFEDTSQTTPNVRQAAARATGHASRVANIGQTAACAAGQASRVANIGQTAACACQATRVANIGQTAAWAVGQASRVANIGQTAAWAVGKADPS